MIVTDMSVFKGLKMTTRKPDSWFIVGLGWLGEALRLELQAHGHKAEGTHRTEFDFLRDEFPVGNWDVVFLNTPPLTQLAPTTYVNKLKGVTARRLIFISSTSVYGAKCGEVTEEDAPSPDAPGGQWLALVEEELRATFGDRLLIIRPGGLIGGKRHPVFHLQGRVGVSGGDERVNLIHRSDLVSIILNAPVGAGLINAIAPDHPRKDDYYTMWARQLGLTPPQFTDSGNEARVIHSNVLPKFYSQWSHGGLDRL